MREASLLSFHLHSIPVVLPCSINLLGRFSSGVPIADFTLEDPQSGTKISNPGKFRKGILQVTDLYGGKWINGSEPVETRSPDIGVYDPFALFFSFSSFLSFRLSYRILMDLPLRSMHDVEIYTRSTGSIKLLSNGRFPGI